MEVLLQARPREVVNYLFVLTLMGIGISALILAFAYSFSAALYFNAEASPCVDHLDALTRLVLVAWSLVCTVIQGSSVLIRCPIFGMLYALRFRRHRGTLVDRASALFRGSEWKINLKVGQTSIYWTLVGWVVMALRLSLLWFREEEGEQCFSPPSRVALVILLLLSLRLLFSYVLYFVVFVERLELGWLGFPSAVADEHMLADRLRYTDFVAPPPPPPPLAEDGAPNATPTDRATENATVGSAGETNDNAPCCSVCYSDFVAGDKVASLPCSPLHVFHVDCVIPWLRIQKTCPLCAKEIDDDLR